ncbi:MAG: hypothetical protein HUU23_02470 [Caldilineales bacterium]|nr:hypothetical protein [Caldilineales bacterium]
MTTWRDLVLRHFQPATAYLSLVADPDDLLLEEQVLAALGARGYELLTFADPILRPILRCCAGCWKLP